MAKKIAYLIVSNYAVVYKLALNLVACQFVMRYCNFTMYSVGLLKEQSVQGLQ